MSAKILIIDDEPSARLTLENLLFAEGYTLQFAKNGSDGLIQAYAWQPDVILADVMMPGMDGFELCRRLRTDANLAQVPIILMTALNDRNAKINGLQAGADDFLTKPIDTIELRVRLRTLTNLDRFRKLTEEHLQLDATHQALVQAHEALRTSETRYRSLIETSSDAIFLVDQETHQFISANPAATNMYGYTHEEFLQMHVAEISAEPHKSLEAIRNSVLYVPERLHRRKDGTFFPVEIVGSYFTENGRRLHTAFIRDITRRKRMESALEAESIRRRILLEESPDGILIIDPQTAGFLEFNTIAHTQLGYTREEFAQLHIYDVEVQETAEETQVHINQVLQQGKSDFETLQRTKQGEIRNIHVTAQLIQILEKKVYYCTWRDITERKRAEEARRESDERYHLLFQSMAQGVVFQNSEGLIVQANPAAERILGLSFEQMQGRNSADVRWSAIHEDGSPFPGDEHPSMIALRTGQRVHNTVMGVYNPVSESYCWLNINAVPRFLNGWEKPYQVYTTFEDITNRKNVEDQLRESETKYRNLIDGMNDAVWVIDQDMSILDVNQVAPQVLGYTREELLKLKVPDIDEALKLEQIQQLIDTLPIDKVQIFETRHKTRDGRLLPVEISSSLITYQGRTVIMSIARDLTERKRAEEALRISEARFATVFRSSPNAVGIARVADNTLIDVNNAWEQVTEWSREEAIGKTPVELGLWVDPSERERMKALVAENHAAHGFEMQMRTRNGSILNLLMSAEIIDLQGVPCLLSMGQDITERKRVENALFASEKQLKSLIESQTHFVIRVNMEGKYSYWNVQFEREFGWLYEPEGIRNSQVLRAVAPYHHQRVKDIVAQCVAQPGKVFSVEIDKPARDGSARTTLWEFICLTDENNQPVEIQCMGLEITDRKQAEKALRENEERFRALIEYAPDGVVLITAEGKFTYASPSVERVFGYTQEDLPFCNSVAMTHPEDLSYVLPELATLLADPSYIPTLQYRFLHKNGEWRWIESTFSNLLALPSIEAIIINFRDIHERKLADEALAKSQALLTEAQRMGHIGHMEWKTPDQALICSEEVYEILGLPAETVITQLTISAMMTPEEQKRLQELDLQSILQRKDMNYEYRIQRQDGSERWLHQLGKVTYGENSAPIRMMAIIQDITERKQTEETLRESRSRIEMALRGANAGMWDWNVQTGEAVFNDRWAEMLGYTLQELEPISIQTWVSLCHPDDLKVSDVLLKKHFAGETDYYECEARMKHKNGSWIWVINRGSVMEWTPDGKPVRMFGTHLDITARKREEQYTKARLRLANLAYEALDMESLMRTMLDEAEALTDSTIGFFHFVDDDQNTISLQAWSTNTLTTLCTAEGKGQHYPVDQAGVWADCIRDGEPHIYNDYFGLEHRHPLPEGHAPVIRLISLPIKRDNLVVAALGVGNKPADYDQQDLELVKRLAEDAFDIILRKRAEKALRESEENFRTVADFTYDLEYWVDENHQLLYISPACQRITGYRREEFLHDPALLQRIVHPADQDLYETHLREEFDSPEAVTLDFRIITSDGKERWINHTCQGVYGADGKPRGRRGSNRDITGRKLAEEEVRASEEKYRLLSEELELRVQQRTAEVQDLYENAPTGYHSLDASGKFVAINQTELNWLGYTREEVLDHSFAEFVTPESAEVFKTTFLQLKNNGKVSNLEFDMRRKDGSTFPVLLNAVAILDDQGTYLRSRSTLFDNTEHKQAESALRESEATYRALFENSSDGIFLLSPAREVLRTNQRALDILGFTHEEFKDLAQTHRNPAVTDLSQRTDAEQKFAAVVAGERIPPYERMFTTKDGRSLPVEINLSPICDVSGNLIMVQSVVRDISLRKQVEDTIRHANAELERALRLKDEFLANMSHELRTPLNSILGMAESLLEEIRGPLNERQRHMVSIIDASGHHLLTLINDILDLSKIEAGKLEVYMDPVPIEDICQASLAFIKQPALKKGLSLVYVPDPTVNTILADMRRLKQILVNLLSNAVKFTASPGKVTLQVEANMQKQTVDISVIDTGIGIASEDIARLFLPFTQVDSSLTRQYEGTGLGLALVKELTELHGGRVWVTSEVGKGSTFTVSIPWQNDAAVEKWLGSPEQHLTPAQSPAPLPDPSLFKSLGKVLLADDVNLNTIALGDYLSSLGYTMIYATNGREAIEKTWEYSPDVILMDVQMPEMDGLEATRRLRAIPRFAHLPIIALTAMAMTGDRERCLQAGATDYISKPVGLKQLAELIRNLLNGK